jgi:hypothetical protein
MLDAIKVGLHGIELENYLREKSTQRTRAWGFTLGFGTWKVWSKDKKTLSAVTAQNIDGNLKVSYLGFRSYEDAEKAWMADLRASMSAFSASAAPGAGEFSYGINLHYEWRGPHIGRNHLREFLNSAVVWHALDEADEENMFGALREKVSSQHVSLHLNLIISDAAFRILLPLVAAASVTEIGAALARAMPWWSVAKCRQSVSTREKLYSALWERYLRENGHGSPTYYADLARKTLQKTRAAKHLAVLEGKDRYAAARAYTFAGLIELNPNTARSFKTLCTACRNLDAAIETAQPHASVQQALDSAREVFAQSHHLHTAAALFLALAQQAGVERDLESTFFVKTPADDFLFSLAT